MSNRYHRLFYFQTRWRFFIPLQTHTQRNGRANMQYKFRLGRWTDGRNVRIIHPSLFSILPLFSSSLFSPSPYYLFENSNGNPRNGGRDRRMKEEGERGWRLGDSLGRGTGWKTSGLGVSRRKWRGFSSLLSSKTVSPVVPSSGFVRAPLSLHTIQSFFLPSAKTMRNRDLWSLVLSTPPRGSRGFTIVSCLCLIFSESFILFSIAWSYVFFFFFSLSLQ